MKKLTFLLPFLWFLSCGGHSVASLDAKVVTIGDVTGTGSTRARINFTKFTQPPGPGGNDQNLRMSFSNPEGDTMEIVLSPDSGGNFPVQSYYFNTSANTFNASFTVSSNGSPQNYTVTTSNGFLNLNSLTLENGIIKAVKASLSVNLDIGGAATGTINY